MLFAPIPIKFSLVQDGPKAPQQDAILLDIDINSRKALVQLESTRLAIWDVDKFSIFSALSVRKISPLEIMQPTGRPQ